MYQTINEYDFIQAFKESPTYHDTFTVPGLRALYEYAIEYESESDMTMEFDMVALCCDYTEYESAWDAMRCYKPEDMPTVENSEGMDLLELSHAIERLCLKWLQDNTEVIEFKGGIIIANF